MTTYLLNKSTQAHSLLPMEQKDIALILGVTQQRVSQLLYRYKVWERTVRLAPAPLEPPKD